MDAVAQLMGSCTNFDCGSSSDDESQSSASSAGQQAGSDNLSQQNNVAVAPPEQQNENVPPQNNLPPRPVLSAQQQEELNNAVETFIPTEGLSEYEEFAQRNKFKNNYKLFLLGLLSSKPSAVRPRTPNDSAEQERPRALVRGNEGGRVNGGTANGGDTANGGGDSRAVNGEDLPVRRSNRVAALVSAAQAEEEADPPVRRSDRIAARGSGARAGGPQAEEEEASTRRRSASASASTRRRSSTRPQLDVAHADAVSSALVAIGSQICTLPTAVPDYPNLSINNGQISHTIKAALGAERTSYAPNAISFPVQLHRDANDQNVAGIEYVPGNVGSYKGINKRHPDHAALYINRDMSPITSSSNYGANSSRVAGSVLADHGFRISNFTRDGNVYQYGDADHEVLLYEREDNLFSSEETCEQIMTKGKRDRMNKTNAVMNAFLTLNPDFNVPTGTHTTWLAQYHSQA